MEEDNLPDVKGRIIVLYLSDAGASLQHGVLFEYASFVRQGGRLFVVGRVPELEAEDWSAKLQGGVPWDSVVHYLLFESREDYLQRRQAYKPPWWKRLSR
jgi:hypothetical protein